MRVYAEANYGQQQCASPHHACDAIVGICTQKPTHTHVGYCLYMCVSVFVCVNMVGGEMGRPKFKDGTVSACDGYMHRTSFYAPRGHTISSQALLAAAAAAAAAAERIMMMGLCKPPRCEHVCVRFSPFHHLCGPACGICGCNINLKRCTAELVHDVGDVLSAHAESAEKSGGGGQAR